MTNGREQTDNGGRKHNHRSTDLWYRWYGDRDVPFHRYCDFRPGIGARRSPEDNEGIQISYIRGLPRALLQFTPLVVLTSVVLFVVSTELRSDMIGISDYLPALKLLELLPILVGGVGWVIVLLYLLKAAGIFPDRNFLKAVIVYGLGVVLFVAAIGAVVKVYGGFGGEDAASSGMDPFGNFSDILRSSGFWLTFLIGGCLTYDMILRVENLFSQLPKKHPAIIEPIDEFEQNESVDGDGERDLQKKRIAAYEEAFLEDFSESLDSDINVSVGGRAYSIRTSYVFALLFTLPFFVNGPVLSAGSFPNGLVKILTSPTLFVIAFVSTVLVFVNVVVFFQFLVLVYYFRRLLVNHSPDNDAASGFWLKYRPRHPDGNAGFRDMGRFATRINGLLILGGFYLAYRFYVGGAYPLPSGSVASPAMVRWLLEMGGPFMAYLIGVIVWIYFSFWRLHKTMRRGRERRIEAEVESHDGELPDGKQDFKSAPLWPVNTPVFLTLFISDLLPLLSLFPVL